MRLRRKALVLSLFASALLPRNAHAVAADALIQGALMCTQHLPRFEREYGIPTHLLSAIASTESGRYHSGLKIKVPWPWSINAGGKGYIFDTREQAIAAVKRMQAQGIKSIDIGCMQVNLHHHPAAFASIEDAFDPQRNIAYAAGFLRTLYQGGGSWKKAAGDYHSRTPALGREYVGLVYNSWYQIIDKLRAARMQMPEGAQFAANAPGAEAASGAPAVATPAAPGYTPAQPVYLQVGSGARPSGVKVARLPEQEGRKLASYHSPRMNSISLSKRERENGVIVVRPDIRVMDAAPPAAAKPEPARPVITLADAGSTASPMITPVAAPMPEARVIRVGAASPRKAGPNFIFSD